MMAHLRLLRLVLVVYSVLADRPRSVLADRDVHFDERSLWIDGQRTLVLSGAIHYARVPVGDWDRLLKLAKAMGLNTVQTYTMWNFHEHKRGELDWSGRANLTHFLTLAAQNDLMVTLRIGPYVCGEYQFGGIPVWLRSVDNVTCFRCSDSVWKREMARFVGLIVEQARPFLASAGGPIIMLQVENEYNGRDEAYLRWAVDMANALTPGSSVPWNLCHDHALCAKVNRDANGSYAFKALCTINGFWMEEYQTNPSQPSPKWLADLRSASPGQPGIWTEDQGWFECAPLPVACQAAQSAKPHLPTPRPSPSPSPSTASGKWRSVCAIPPTSFMAWRAGSPLGEAGTISTC